MKTYRACLLFLSLLIASPAAALQVGDGQYNNTYNDLDLAATQARFNNITTKGAGGGVPVGSIIAWPVATNPEDMENWLECNGQAVDAAMYPELRAVIGANVPDLRGRVLQQYDSVHIVGSKIEAGLPNIQGDMSYVAWLYAHAPTGAFKSTTINNAFTTKYHSTISIGSTRLRINAADSNPVYGSSDTVQPPAYAVRYLIRALP